MSDEQAPAASDQADASEEQGRMNKSQLAKILGIRRQTLYKHLDKPGAPAAGDDGRYDLGEVARFIAHEREANLNPSDPQYVMERALLARARREELERKSRASDDRYVEREAVVTWIGEQFGALRQRLMAIPGSVAARLEAKKPKRIEQILTEVLGRTLNQYAKLLEKHKGAVPPELKMPPKKKAPAKQKAKPKKKAKPRPRKKAPAKRKKGKKR